MVNPDVIEAINYTKDLDFEYNIKLILIVSLYAYAILFLWLSYKVDLDWWWYRIVKVITRVVGWAWFFGLPLFWLLLLRTASFEIVYSYILGIYSITISIMMLLFFLGFSEFGLKMLGFEVSPKKVKLSPGFMRRFSK